MGQSDPRDTLLALLEEEKTLVLSGRLDGLAELAQKKHAAIQALRRAPVSGDFEKLRARAQANEALLRAAEQGMKRALRRIRDIRQQSDRLETYGREGQRETHTSPHRNLEKHA